MVRLMNGLSITGLSVLLSLMLLVGGDLSSDTPLSPKSAQAESLYTVTVVKTGSGNGTVTTGGLGLISCGTRCSASYPSSISINLEAQEDFDSTFVRWGGACEGAGTSRFCSLFAESDLIVTADFAGKPRDISVERIGAGEGTVVSSPSGLECRLSCSGSFAFGATVILTPRPSKGSKFDGWGGACAGSEITCEVAMTSNRHATASFSLKPSDPEPKPVNGKDRVRLCGVLPGDGAYGYVKTRGVTCRTGWRVSRKARKKFCANRNGCSFAPYTPESIQRSYRGQVKRNGWRCSGVVKWEFSRFICRKGERFIRAEGGA